MENNVIEFKPVNKQNNSYYALAFANEVMARQAKEKAEKLVKRVLKCDM